MAETLTPDPPAAPAQRSLPALPDGYKWWDGRRIGFLGVLDRTNREVVWVDECFKGGDYFWMVRNNPERLSFWEAVHLAATQVWMGETK